MNGVYLTSERAADGTYSFRCVQLASDRRTNVRLGCAHKTPREAIAHTSDSYVSPLRATSGAPGSVVGNSAVEDPSPALRGSPAANPPSAGGDLPLQARAV